jgi:tetratricopeptide (TPR) repeat protein
VDHPNLVLKSKENFEAHLLETHPELGLTQAQQLANFAENTIPDERLACPFCLSTGPFLGGFATHMAFHQEKIATFALPRNIEVQDDELSHSSQAQGVRSSDSLGSVPLSEDHPDRLASQYELARAYQTNGQVEQAVKLFEHVAKIQETTLAEDHPDRLASQYELARAYQTNGQFEEAVKLLEYVLQIRETILAEDHPDRLASQYELARAYQALGRVKEAMNLLEHVAQIQRKTFAEDHRSRLASEYALAVAYQANGRVEEAVKLLEQISEITNGQMPLSRAAQDGQEAVVRLLLDTGKVDVDLKDERGRTPLWWAAEGGHLAVVELLLSNGADVNTQGGEYGNALQAASQGGHLAVVELLLAKGAMGKSR